MREGKYAHQFPEPWIYLEGKQTAEKNSRQQTPKHSRSSDDALKAPVSKSLSVLQNMESTRIDSVK